MRYTGQRLYSLHVPATLTNQRLWFDIEPCGRHLLAGGSMGNISTFDLSTGTQIQDMAAAPDTVSSVALHSTLPLVATTSGHRRFLDEDGGENADHSWDGSPLPHGSNSLCIWHLQSGGSTPIEQEECEK